MARSKRQPPVPDRSPEQRLAALQRANEIRGARAELKRDLKEGRVTIGEVVREPPEYAKTAKLFDLLLAVPKLGPAKAARLLKQCAINEAKTVGGLSERQRAELVRLLPF